ncbi:MAG: COX15/CtaA family protein [Anaerolineae bacterium]|nr:COX15/CtaA family protein [Anaerolineae bacterium]
MTPQAPSIESIRRFKNLLFATAVMTFLLIVMGGIVRVTGSGLGCPDWPTCFGKWIPPMRADAIIEYLHRLAATFASPLILASFFVAWWRFRPIRLITRSLFWACILLAVQALLGGLVVIFETPPGWVAVHLANALLIFALILLPLIVTITLVRNPSADLRLDFSTPFSRRARHTLIALFIVLVSGAFVAGTNATMACSGWPLCNGQLFPSHYLGWIHMLHRTLVAIVTYSVISLYLASRRDTALPLPLKRTTSTLLVLFLIQAAVGAVKVSYRFPVFYLGAHVAVAAAVWAAAVILAAMAALSTPSD